MSTVAILRGIGLIARILISSMSAFLETEIQQHLRHYQPSALLEHIVQLMQMAQLEQGQTTPILIAKLQEVFSKHRFVDLVSLIRFL